MPKLSHFLYCESVQIVGEDKKPSIIAPLQVLSPKYIPSNYSFAIAFGLSGVDIEKDNNVQVKFFSPSDIIMADSKIINIPKYEKEIKLPPELRGIMLTMDFRNVSIPQVGEYRAEIYLNDKLIGTQPITVFKGVENEL